MPINPQQPEIRFLPHFSKVLRLLHGGPHFLPCTPCFRKVRQNEFDPKSCRFLPQFGTHKTRKRKTRDRGIQPADARIDGPPDGFVDAVSATMFCRARLVCCCCSYSARNFANAARCWLKGNSANLPIGL